MKVLNPQYMGEVTPKKEGFTWVPMVVFRIETLGTSSKFWTRFSRLNFQKTLSFKIVFF